MSSVAMFYHIQAHRNFLSASPMALTRKSDYTLRFYDNVMNMLKKRGLVEKFNQLVKSQIHLYESNKYSNKTSFFNRSTTEFELDLIHTISNASPDGLRVPASRPDMKWINYSVIFQNRFF
jgi:hypothetical protein